MESGCIQWYICLGSNVPVRDATPVSWDDVTTSRRSRTDAICIIRSGERGRKRSSDPTHTPAKRHHTFRSSDKSQHYSSDRKKRVSMAASSSRDRRISSHVTSRLMTNQLPQMPEAVARQQRAVAVVQREGRTRREKCPRDDYGGVEDCLSIASTPSPVKYTIRALYLFHLA